MTLVVFHALTWLMFPSIGLFPLLMSLSALVFFDPAWPERFRRAPREESDGRIPRRAAKLHPAWLGLSAVYLLLMLASHFAIISNRAMSSGPVRGISGRGR